MNIANKPRGRRLETELAKGEEPTSVVMASAQLSTTTSSSPGLDSPCLSASPPGTKALSNQESPEMPSSPSCNVYPQQWERGLLSSPLSTPHSPLLGRRFPKHAGGMVSPYNSCSRQTNYDFTMHDGLSDASSCVSHVGESDADRVHQLLSMQGAIEKSAGDRLMSRRSAQQTTGEEMFDRGASSCRPQSATPVVTSDPGLSLAPLKDEALTTSPESSDDKSSTLAKMARAPHDDSSAYDHLQVSEKISGLFQYIDLFKPQGVEIGIKLKPFIPDYIPAIGAIDEFLKVPRPDGVPDYLGLKVLDESGPKQSDPAVVTLQLRAASMQSNQFPFQVTSIANADKNPRRIDAWINNIKDLHRTKPPPSVIYTKLMPDIEKLMQEWPPEMEKVLGQVELPSSKLDVDLATFSDICCAILDIPVYKSRVESLHLLFSLYLEFKNHPHFAGPLANWESRH